MADFVLALVRPAFRAVACAVVPEAARLDAASWSDVERIVDDALERRPAAIRRQLVAFLRLLDVLARVRHRRSLVGLDVTRLRSLLERVERAPAFPLRRGMWGLRTLVFMGYYGRAEAAAEIGYTARLRGWRERGGTGAVIPLVPPGDVQVEPRAAARPADLPPPDDRRLTAEG